MKVDGHRVGQQYIEADWQQQSANEWDYSGKWVFNAKIDGKYSTTGVGIASGIVTAKDYWIDKHVLEWTRTLEISPFENTLVQYQQFSVSVQRIN